MVTKRPLLMGCFLKHLETSLFHWRWFCRCANNWLTHTFPRTWNSLINGALILKIYLACSFADAMFSSGNFFTHFREQICIFVFCTCALHPKLALVSSGTKTLPTLWKNWKCRVICCCAFSWRRESWTFERLSILLERPIDFDDFLEQIRYSCNGRHV